MQGFAVDEDTIIGDILDVHPACAKVFAGVGMSCISCPAARGESLREACEIHEIDVRMLLESLRTALSSN